MTPTLSFIIPVRDDAERLAGCLESIRRSAGNVHPVEVIVADNGSTDGSAAVGAAGGARVLVMPDCPVGALRNAGSALSRGQILAFVDADHLIADHWVATALAAFEDPRVGAVGALCHAPEDGTWVQLTYDRLRRHPSGTTDVDWLGSGNMAIRRDVFERAGRFDPTLQTCEDVDLSRRIRAAGFRLVADSRMHNVHLGDPRTLLAVFRGELWRGRDNVRVSLRPPVAWRDVASMAVSGVTLAALIGLLGAAAIGSSTGVLAAAACAAIIVLLVCVRVARMIQRGDQAPLSVARAFAVAAAYEFGRAAALVFGGTHRHRRSAGASS